VTSGGFLLASIYVLIVAATATSGFVRESTPTILLAAALSLPASVIAVPGYYLAYGLLAFVTHANPSDASGSTSCTAAGDCTSSTSGDPAVWFQVTTDILGLLALTCAAALNAFLLCRMAERRRRGRDVEKA
jgi:hypothetical protein